MSTKDTVNFPVKMYTLECGYRSCMFRTGDHIHGDLEDDHRWLLETHFKLEHSAPPLVMMEGAADKVSWEAFAEWDVHYSYKILADERQDHMERLFAFLETHLGDVSKLIRDKLGERYSELTELDLLLEAEGVTVWEQEEKIGAEK